MLRLERSGNTFIIILFASLITALFLLLFLAITGVVVALVGLHQLTRFANASGYTTQELISAAKAGWTTQPVASNNHKNFLILGTDQLPTRGNAVVLSDTILLVSADLSTGTLTALSLPRDLWLPEYQTKINALYTYGTERNPEQPTLFATQTISELTQVPIHHTLVLSIDQLARMVDLVGGVEVNVAESFSDPLFPRPDVDVTTEKDPTKLYKTVTFEAGTQTLDGARTLEYVRSRKSQGDQGGDEARTRRQQEIITALMQKLSQPKTYFNLNQTAQLAKYYKETFSNQLPLVELIATAKALYPHRSNITFEGRTLSIYPEDPAGVITHPPLNRYNGQWVYIYRDLEIFQNEVRSKLSLPASESATQR